MLMKKLLIVLASIFVLPGIFYLSAYSEKDGIMKKISSQVAKVGQESSITLLVLDKNTGNPMDNANVILHIEEGAPMESMKGKTMMDMMQRMFEAENIGAAKYLVKFTPTKQGYYTMHTHAIPPGQSMMSMMNNHMDIGLSWRYYMGMHCVIPPGQSMMSMMNNHMDIGLIAK